MWLEQLGLEATAEMEKQVMDAAQAIAVNGVDSTLYSMDGAAGQSILVARIPWNENESLFAKLSGPTELVASQRAEFAQFVESIQW